MNNYYSLIEKAFLLKKTKIFSSLDLDLLLDIADKMEVYFLQEKESIFTQNNRGTRLYIIAEGTVLITNEEKTIDVELHSTEFFGEEILFNERLRSYSATCKTNVIALSLQKTQLFNIISECPSVAISIIESYATNVDFRKR